MPQEPSATCPTHPRLAAFEPLLTALGHSGIRVTGVCRSHQEGTFTAPNEAAVVRTNVGAFEVIVFEPDFNAEQLVVTTSAVMSNGNPVIHQTVTGLPTFRTPLESGGTQRALYLTHRNWLVITYDTAIEQRVVGALGLLERGTSRPCP
jgi:hypothetical protein